MSDAGELKITKPLSASNRKRLDVIVQKRGIGPVSKALCIHRTTIARALCGFALYGGSRAAIEFGLDAIEALETVAAHLPDR